MPPPPKLSGNLVLLTGFEVLTCGANPPRRDLLLLCTTAVRFAAGDEGGVFVPQAVWAAVDNLLAHDDCRILFVVLKSNATVPLSILIYPYCYRILGLCQCYNGQPKYQPDLCVYERYFWAENKCNNGS